MAARGARPVGLSDFLLPGPANAVASRGDQELRPSADVLAALRPPPQQSDKPTAFQQYPPPYHGPQQRPLERPTFPVGDWFLGPNDGGQGGLMLPKAPNSKVKQQAVEVQVDVTHEDKAVEEKAGQEVAKKGFLDKLADKVLEGLNVNQAKQEAAEAAEAPKVNPDQLLPPWGAYGGELQILEDHRSSTLVYSDLTDSSRWTCKKGPRPNLDLIAANAAHPVLQFSEPQQKIVVHLEDMAAGPGRKVLWDAVYDLGGIETLKYGFQPESGRKPDFHLFCPPRNGPPHWYELTVSKLGNGGRRHMLEDFVASQTVTTYRPDQDPEVLQMDDLHLQGCAVQ